MQQPPPSSAVLGPTAYGSHKATSATVAVAPPRRREGGACAAPFQSCKAREAVRPSAPVRNSNLSRRRGGALPRYSGPALPPIMHSPPIWRAPGELRAGYARRLSPGSRRRDLKRPAARRKAEWGDLSVFTLPALWQYALLPANPLILPDGAMRRLALITGAIRASERSETSPQNDCSCMQRPGSCHRGRPALAARRSGKKSASE